MLKLIEYLNKNVKGIYEESPQDQPLEFNQKIEAGNEKTYLFFQPND